MNRAVRSCWKAFDQSRASRRPLFNLFYLVVFIIIAVTPSACTTDGVSAISPEPQAASRSESAPPQEDLHHELENDVLIDYRSELSYEAPKLRRPAQARIAQAVFNKENDSAVINSARAGSFTRAGAKEVVYLIQEGGPRALDPQSLNKTVLAVFSGARLVARVDASDFNFIIRLSDLNNDGINELLVEGSFYNMGTLISWGRLIQLKDNRLEVIKEFDKLFKSTCDGDAKPAEMIATAISFSSQGRGNWPAFSKKLYRAPCPKTGKRNPAMFSEAPDARIEGR